MRFQASETSSLTKPEEDDDAALDVTSLVAGQVADTPTAEPYKSPTLALLRVLWRYFNPKANGLHRGLAVLAALAFVAWPLGFAVSAATQNTSPVTTATASTILGAILGAILMWRSHRRDAIDAYCRTHLALMAAGAMSFGGLLPPAMLMNSIAPMTVAFGAASFLVLICLGWSTPVKEAPEQVPEAGEAEA